MMGVVIHLPPPRSRDPPNHSWYSLGVPAGLDNNVASSFMCAVVNKHRRPKSLSLCSRLGNVRRSFKRPKDAATCKMSSTY